MGIHDYQCFLMNNGQNLTDYKPLPAGVEEDFDDFLQNREDYESDNAGACKGMIVKLPKDVNPYDLALKQFANYPVVEVQYSWDDWDFDRPFSGYREVLTADDVKHSIWKHNAFPEEILVNFSPSNYEFFVKHSCSSKEIPYACFYEIFENNDLSNKFEEIGRSKRELYNYVVENLPVRDKKYDYQLLPLAVEDYDSSDSD